MYSIVLMAAVGGGADAPAFHNRPAAAVVVVGCTGYSSCTGCTGYAACYGCSGYSSCNGCCGGGFLGHKSRGGCSGMFGHHNKHSCTGYSSCHGCTGYASCYGSYASGWCQGFGAVSSYGCTGTYPIHMSGCNGCTGYGFGCGGAVYPSYSYPHGLGNSYPYMGGGTVVIPPETPKVETPKSDAKVDPKGTGKGASLNFKLPAGAALYVDGRKTAGDGTDRAFYTPPLEAGQKYFYDIKAVVTVGGQEVTDERRVVVEAGTDQTVEFARLIAAAAGADAVAGK